MMLSMYTDATLNELRSNIKLNMPKYAKGEKFVFDFIDSYEAKLYPLDIEVEFPTLDKTIASKESIKQQWEIDFENSINLYKNFVLKYGISMQVLSDERFIAFLTHDVYYDFMNSRWPITNKEGRVREKYFLSSGNQAFTRNLFLKSFWYPYITYDKDAKDPFWLTKIAFEYADPVNQIMERKYSRNDRIVKSALIAISNVKESKGLNAKRTMYGKAINNILGMYCLDIISEKELVKLFETEIRKIVISEVVDDELIEEE